MTRRNEQRLSQQANEISESEGQSPMREYLTVDPD